MCPFCLATAPEGGATGRAAAAPSSGLSRAGIFHHGSRARAALLGSVVGTSLLAASCGDFQSVAAYGIACDPDGCTYPGDELVLADAQINGDAGLDATGDSSPADGATSPETSVEASTDAPADALGDAPPKGDAAPEGGHDGAPDGKASTEAGKDSQPPDAPHG